MRYVKLNAVDNYITLDEQEYHDVDELAFQGMTNLQIYPVLEHTIVSLEVKNYKATLPKDLLKIRYVAVMNREPSDVDYNSLCSECVDSEEGEVVCTACSEGTATLPGYSVGLMEKPICRIRHQGITRVFDYYSFVNSSFYTNNFDIMREKRTPFTAAFMCKNCEVNYSTCSDTYEITPNGDILTSFEDGVICIDYFKYATDEDGDFLIPDHPTLIEAIANYVMWKHWEQRWNMNVQGAYDKMKYYRDRWVTKKTVFKGEVVLENYDPVAANQSMYKDIKSARSPKVFNEGAFYYSKLW